jgi:GDP-L-fucose synthase
VIPALIKRFDEAVRDGLPVVDVWGTGAASREFLHVDDAARGIRMATEAYDGLEPVNLGAGFEITIHELTQLIARLIGFTGDIRWDTSKPDGQPRRSLDTTKAEGLFGFRAEIGFEEGLQKTIAWYRQHQATAQ